MASLSPNGNGKKSTNWPAWIGISLTAISMLVASIVFAFNSQSDLKEWTYTKTSDAKMDIISNVSENYVKKSEFAKLEQSMVDQREDMKELKVKIDRLIELSMKKRHE